MQIKPQSPDAGSHAEQFNALEISCLTYLAQGHSIEDSCVALSVSEAEWHDVLAAVELKLGARNRMHAVILAMRLGIVEDMSKHESE